MHRIHIEKIEEGQVLAKPVLDDFGNVILNSGFRLSPAWSNRLKLRKVEYIFISDGGDDLEGSAEESAVAPISKSQKIQIATEVSQVIDHMFQDVQDHEIMQYLAEAAKCFAMRKELDS